MEPSAPTFTMKRGLETLSTDELEVRCEAIAAKRRELEREEHDLARALAAAREREERARPQFLSPGDEKTLRRSLTVVGELLANEAVLYGGFDLEDADPDAMESDYCGEVPFSLTVSTGFCLDICPGLQVNATLKTRNAKVREIVREMITSTESIPDEAVHCERTHWGIHWDYYTRIELKNPMSSDMYYEKRNDDQHGGGP